MKTIKKIPANVKVRYIKLGEKGKYEDICLRDGRPGGILRIGYHEFPHFGEGVAANKILAACRECANKRLAEEKYKDQGAATRHANQVAEFYQCDDKTLWITFARGHLWWCFAKQKVKFFGHNRERFPEGSRERETIGGWSNKSIRKQRVLNIHELGGHLAKTAAFRGTICKVASDAPEVLEYLVRVINDDLSSDAEEAKERRGKVLESIITLARKLNPKDFELLVDLVFSRSGWRRKSLVGGTQKTVDFILELPSTDESAFVQVKTKTNAKQFQDCEKAFLERDESRMFYVFSKHTGKEPMSDNDGITVINAEKLAPMILDAGLFDWLLNKSGF